MSVDELVKKLQAEQEYRPTAVAVIYRGEGAEREYLILKTSNSEIDPDDPFPNTWLLLQVEEIHLLMLEKQLKQ